MIYQHRFSVSLPNKPPPLGRFRKIEGFESKGARLLLDSAEINLLNGHINNPNQTTKTLLDSSKEAGLEVNAEKTGCIIMSLDFRLKPKYKSSQ
jgi:Fe-S cluster assembly iron-binding protein IscA